MRRLFWKRLIIRVQNLHSEQYSELLHFVQTLDFFVIWQEYQEIAYGELTRMLEARC